MRPTEILMREHRVIEQVLNCLEVIAERAEAGGAVDAEAAAQAVDFFRGFADRCHHGKEEAHLFPLMEAKGFPREGGPTGVMLAEHDEGRRHVRAMAEAIRHPERDDAAARAQLIDHARAFIQLLRQHIQKEDSCLFAMADQALSEADQQALMAAFTKVEQEEIGAATHARYVELADRLADRLGVGKAEDTTGGPRPSQATGP